MKINAESILDKFSQYKFKENMLLISGNETSLISKIENLVIKHLKNNRVSEIKFIDIKINKNPNFDKLINSQSLFGDENIIHIKNPNDLLITRLNEINNHKNTVIISGENIKNNSKIKKFFDLHKKFYSVSCYKLSMSFKKKMINKFISLENHKLTKEAYWFLLEETSNKYQLLENELTKISIYNKENITIEEIKRL